MDHQKDQGFSPDPAAGKVPLKELWANFLVREGSRLRPSTVALYETQWKNIEPVLGGRAINSISRRDVEELLTDMIKNDKGAPSIEVTLRLLHRLLEVAVSSELIFRNPVTGIKAPKSTPREGRALSVDQVWDLAEAIEPRWRAAILLMGFCGLRIGEVAALTVDRVDFLKGRIRVEEQLVEVRGTVHRGPTKSGKKRAVPVPRFVLDELAVHIENFVPSRTGLLFIGEKGGPLRRNKFRRAIFAPAVQKVGLEPLRPHDLRHSAVTIAIAAGSSLKAVQALAGHASAALTADRYGHYLESVAQDAADRIEAIGRRGPALQLVK